MKRLRSTILLAALFLASQAHAAVTTVSFKGRLQDATGALEGIYADDTPFSGMLTIDDNASPFGTVYIGGNTISFSHSEAMLHDAGFYTALSVESGDYWGTGGQVHETWDLGAGLGVSGLRMSFSYPAGIPWRTPLSEILAMQPVRSTSLLLNYGGFDSAYGYIDEITPMGQVPEPAGVLLMGLGLGVLVARRCRQPRAD